MTACVQISKRTNALNRVKIYKTSFRERFDKNRCVNPQGLLEQRVQDTDLLHRHRDVLHHRGLRDGDPDYLHRLLDGFLA